MITLKQVNLEIAKSGIIATLVKMDSYFLFIGDDIDAKIDSSVMIKRLNQLTLSEWMLELKKILMKGTHENSRIVRFTSGRI